MKEVSKEQSESYKPRVKICGVRSPEIASFCVVESADFIGINLSPVSKRKVSEENAIVIANEIRKSNVQFSKDTKIVLLFFKNKYEDILRIAERVRPDYLQLVWGDESIKDHWEDLRLQYSLLPAFSVSQILQDTDIPFPRTELCIFDTPSTDQGGGTGEVFPWNRLDGIQRDYLLAGGLNPENVGEAISILQPWGVDVATGVESAPGESSREKIREFIENAKR
jgi:phosphoribosylanthranilate isomerase